MDANTERLVLLTIQQLRAKVWVWLVLGLLISAVAIFVALKLPKQYRAYASIRVEQQKVVGSLMEGVAEQTDARDHASIVRELASSRRLLESMLDATDLVDDNASLIAREREMEDIKARTQIENRGGNLIGVAYSDSDPQRAFQLTSMYVDWVISESRSSKQRESQEAYEFIDQQVRDYQEKLRTAEEGLKAYRQTNMDALPESADEVVGRATALRRQLETLELEASELQARETTLVSQLAGEKTISSVRAEESAIRARMAALQQELDTLRLSYHDTYPDIIRLKTQISNLRDQMLAVSDSEPSDLIASGANEQEAEQNFNPLYEQMRGDLASTRTKIQSNQARYQQVTALLEQAIDRSRRIADSEATLSELTRDYEVNRDLYQDLLRRRENARLSMNLDSKQQGVTMKMQEPPAVPATPSGLRFLHVVAAAALLVVCIPFGLSALLVQFDPRIRMKHRLEAMDLEVLAVVPWVDTAPPWRVFMRRGGMVLGSLVLIGLYAGAGWLKYTGQV